MDLLSFFRGRRSAREQAELEAAVAAVDRELAANLELTTMFDQTRQAFVLENGHFAIFAETLQRLVPETHAEAAGLYARIVDAEGAMERRGPANSITEADRAIVETWEGDARHVQRRLRAAAATPPPSGWQRLRARLRVR